MATTATREVEIVNRKGLHARASAMLMGAVAQMDGVRVSVTKDGTSADGGSILDLMMLGAGLGSTIILTVEGEEAEARLDTLVEMVANGFGEN
jgi:phosphocarrier protein HPr